MTVAPKDNSASEELSRTILWQYDNAANLIAIIEMLKSAFKKSTQDFWDAWDTKTVNIDTADDYGLAIWGNILGVKRPMLLYNPLGTKVLLTTEMYRKIIKARFKLLKSNASVKAYCEYLYSIFGNKIKITDNRDMTISFSTNSGAVLSDEEYALINQSPETIFVYPAGVRELSSITYGVFAFDGQQNNRTSSDPVACGFGNSGFKTTS